MGKMYWDFKQQRNETADENTWTWLRNEHFKKETESLRIAAQNNVININYIKAKIDNL